MISALDGLLIILSENTTYEMNLLHCSILYTFLFIFERICNVRPCSLLSVKNIVYYNVYTADVFYSSCLIEALYLLISNSHFLLQPQLLANSIPLYTFMNYVPLDASHKWNHTVFALL